jgi:hypothetical protein
LSVNARFYSVAIVRHFLTKISPNGPVYVVVPIAPERDVLVDPNLPVNRNAGARHSSAPWPLGNRAN